MRRWTCAHIVAAHYQHNFGPSNDYCKVEQGPEKCGSAAKGIRKAPPHRSTDRKGIKTNLHTDEEVNSMDFDFLQRLRKDLDWNPFGNEMVDSVASTRQDQTPGTHVSSHQPAESKPLHPG
ncbi:hypothetical protein DFH07DRAFT_767313 [Mycena maculata]|uniref:Uncharacterized protein n=1 Tax=Mycena maculata TaxID=230809 RepID=A0AAD7NU25_9AGAR|nr:hypothetical protein DFH07DRAFT_767313 [Mycena maculata]